MSKMIIDQIPPDWQKWLLENAGRDCDEAGMIRKLMEGEILSLASATEAVHEAYAKLGKPVVKPQRPWPQFDGSFCAIEGHTIKLVAEMAFPRVLILENLLSAEECKTFIESGKSKLSEVDVVSPTDGTKVKHPARRGQYATFQRGETEFIKKIEQRIAAFTRWPADRGEGFQLIHYGKGDEYRPHFDWFDPALPGSASHLKNGGQRIVSIIIYLNKPEQGGGTCFPKAGGLTLQAHPGSAVYFDNLDESFAGDRKTLHCGDPIREGEKWIATKWLRVGQH